MNSGRGNRYLGRAIDPRPEGETPRGLERRAELRPVSEKRAAKNPKATTTFRAPRPAPRPKEGPMKPDEWKIHVGEQAGWHCEVSGEPLGWDWDAHHVIPKSRLRDRGLHRFVWHPDNGMALQKVVHDRHTFPPAGAPPAIYAHHLSERHLNFARMLDALGDTEEWSAYLQRTYPVDQEHS